MDSFLTVFCKLSVTCTDSCLTVVTQFYVSVMSAFCLLSICFLSAFCLPVCLSACLLSNKFVAIAQCHDVGFGTNLPEADHLDISQLPRHLRELINYQKSTCCVFSICFPNVSVCFLSACLSVSRTVSLSACLSVLSLSISLSRFRTVPEDAMINPSLAWLSILYMLTIHD